MAAYVQTVLEWRQLSWSLSISYIFVMYGYDKMSCYTNFWRPICLMQIIWYYVQYYHLNCKNIAIHKKMLDSYIDWNDQNHHILSFVQKILWLKKFYSKNRPIASQLLENFVSLNFTTQQVMQTLLQQGAALFSLANIWGSLILLDFNWFFFKNAQASI